jgi:hypothetical protein
VSIELSPADLLLLAHLSKAINRTAYFGGLGLQESGKYIGLLARIVGAHGTTVENLVDGKSARELAQSGIIADPHTGTHSGCSSPIDAYFQDRHDIEAK